MVVKSKDLLAASSWMSEFGQITELQWSAGVVTGLFWDNRRILLCLLLWRQVRIVFLLNVMMECDYLISEKCVCNLLTVYWSSHHVTLLTTFFIAATWHTEEADAKITVNLCIDNGRSCFVNNMHKLGHWNNVSSWRGCQFYSKHLQVQCELHKLN